MHIPDAARLAAQAWDATKADDDPDFWDCQPDHRDKLVTVTCAVVDTGNADVAGLEAFENKVRELSAPTEALVPAEEVN